MVRRVVEEDVTTSPTVVERDESWVGRTLVALVVIALLVVATVWLVRTVGDDGTRAPTNVENNDTNEGGTGDTGDTGEEPIPNPT